MSRVPRLIAHRGWPARYPENSIVGMRAALEAGACFVEFDVQISGDGIPVVIHDDNLRRTAGMEMRVPDTPLAELRRVCVGEPGRFRETFADVRLPTLDETIALLSEWPRASAFVELKRASLRHFGTRAMVAKVIERLAPAIDRCIVISFDAEAVELSREAGARRSGWAIEAWDDAHRDAALRLSPDYLFCKLARLPAPPATLWDGPWTWAAYQTDDPDTALALAARGVALVETDDIGALLRHPELKREGCGRG